MNSAATASTGSGPVPPVPQRPSPPFQTLQNAAAHQTVPPPSYFSHHHQPPYYNNNNLGGVVPIYNYYQSQTFGQQHCGVNPYELLRNAEESSKGIFQSVEQIANAFVSVANLLNSTYAAVFNSFRAFLTVFEQLRALKNFFVSTFLISLVKFVRFVWRRFLVILRLRPRNYNAHSESVWANISKEGRGGGGEIGGGHQTTTNYIPNFGALFCWLIAIGGPFLIYKCFCLSSSVLKIAATDWAKGQGEHYTAQALYNFSAENCGELSFSAFDMLRVAPKQRQPNIKDWLLASNSDGSNIGLVPMNYVRILDHRCAVEQEKNDSAQINGV